MFPQTFKEHFIFMTGTSKKELRRDRNSIEISEKYKNEIKILGLGEMPHLGNKSRTVFLKNSSDEKLPSNTQVTSEYAEI